MFAVTILGNNSAVPAFDRHPTSQVVTWMAIIIWLIVAKDTDANDQIQDPPKQDLSYFYFTSTR